MKALIKGWEVGYNSSVPPFLKLAGFGILNLAIFENRG